MGTLYFEIVSYRVSFRIMPWDAPDRVTRHEPEPCFATVGPKYLAHSNFDVDLVLLPCTLRTSMTRVPQELICAIVDSFHTPDEYLHPDARDALRICSLVCRSWLPVCQRRLFHTIVCTAQSCCRTCPAALSPHQALLDSPHLAGYIRELKLWDTTCMFCGKSWMTTHSSLPLVLRNLKNLQNLEFQTLRWSTLPVDLKNSLCWVLQLPSITMLKLSIDHFSRFDDFFNLISHARDLTSLVLIDTRTSSTDQGPLTLGDPQEMGDGRMLTGNRWRRLTDLRLLSYVHPSTILVLVDWLLGPRSLADVSHVEILHIAPPGDVINRLLHTIGSSLKELHVHLPPDFPCEWPLVLNCVPSSNFIEAKLSFDINLEFNTALSLLQLSSLDMSKGIANSTDLVWLLRLLSNINTSNRIQQLGLGLTVDPDDFDEGECVVAWGQVDRILAGAHFKFLQKLEFSIWMFDDEEEADYESLDSEVCDSVCTRIVEAFPLLVGRGVSVEAQPVLLS
jgi:hypothetical protein